MNDTTNDLDQTDEETLHYEISDEALEAAAGSRGELQACTLVAALTASCTLAPLWQI